MCQTNSDYEVILEKSKSPAELEVKPQSNQNMKQIMTDAHGFVELCVNAETEIKYVYLVPLVVSEQTSTK